MIRRFLVAALVMLNTTFLLAEEAHRSIDAEIFIEASVEEVWNAWTTEEGIQTFFAPAANIELRPGGRYEILFSPGSPAGQRGAEDCIVLAVQTNRMLSFTWNSPPTLPEVRKQFTHVTLRFASAGDGKTKLTFHQDGWGEGGEWDESYAYFTRAWKEVVLPNLQKRFAHAKSSNAGASVSS